MNNQAKNKHPKILVTFLLYVSISVIIFFSIVFSLVNICKCGYFPTDKYTQNKIMYSSFKYKF